MTVSIATNYGYVLKISCEDEDLAIYFCIFDGFSKTGEKNPFSTIAKTAVSDTVTAPNNRCQPSQPTP
jgi:hypothetical protein